MMQIYTFFLRKANKRLAFKKTHNNLYYNIIYDIIMLRYEKKTENQVVDKLFRRK